MAFVLVPFICRVLGDIPVALHEFTVKQEGTLPKRELMPVETYAGSMVAPTRHWCGSDNTLPRCPTAGEARGEHRLLDTRPCGLSHLVLATGGALSNLPTSHTWSCLSWSLNLGARTQSPARNPAPVSASLCAVGLGPHRTRWREAPWAPSAF